MAIETTTSVWIQCDPNTAFECATDPAQWPKYAPGIKEGRVLSDKRGAGSQFEVKVKGLGKMTGQWDTWEPGKAMSSHNLTGGFDSSTTMRFTADNGGTRVEQDLKVAPKGLWKLLAPLMSGKIKKDAQLQLDNMKKVIEG